MANGWFPPEECLTPKELAMKRAFEAKKAKEKMSKEDASKAEAEI